MLRSLTFLKSVTTENSILFSSSKSPFWYLCLIKCITLLLQSGISWLNWSKAKQYTLKKKKKNHITCLFKSFIKSLKKRATSSCNYLALHHFISIYTEVLIWHYLPQEPSQTQQYSTLYFVGWCNCRKREEKKKKGGIKKKKMTVIYQLLHNKKPVSILASASDHRLLLLECNWYQGYIKSFCFWHF